MRKTLLAGFLVVIAATAVAAAGGAPLRGGVCIGPFRGADSVVSCEYIGKVTIRQIYEKGFRVVHMQDDKNTASYVVLVIEEQVR
jgi:hypothetical protein